MPEPDDELAQTPIDRGPAAVPEALDEPIPVRRNRIGPDLRPLAYAPYRRLFIGGLISAVGSQLSAVAVLQQLFDITGNNAVLGTASLVALVPLVVFGLWGGSIADKYDRRMLLVVTSIGIAACAIGLWVQALLDLKSVVLVMILLAAQQGFFAVNQPTRSAAIPRLVPKELVPSANALGFSVFGFAVLGGPLLAGVLIPLVGLPWLYFAEAVGMTYMLYPVLRLPSLKPLLTEGVARRSGVLEGLQFLRTQPLILMTFVVDIIAMIFGMPKVLFADMAEFTFGGPAGGGIQFGLLNAGMAIGVVLGGVTSGWLARIHRQGVAIIIAIIVWGLSMVLLGTTASIVMAVVWLAFGGWSDMVSATFRSSILQTAAPDDLRGRMQGVFTVVVAGGPRIADLVHGVAADVTSTTWAVCGGGALVVVGTVIAAIAGPSLWRFDSRTVTPTAS